MKLSSLRENAPAAVPALVWAGAPRRGRWRLSAFQLGCLVALTSAVVTALAGCLSHGVLLFNKGWSWPEVALTGLAAGTVGFCDARACDTDPEAVLHAIMRRQQALGVVPVVLASALGCLCVFGWAGRAEMGAGLLWAAAFVLSATLALWAMSLGAPAAARVLRPLQMAVIGTRAAEREMRWRLAMRSHPLNQVVCVFDPTNQRGGTGPSPLSLPSLDGLITQIRAGAIDAVLIDPAGLQPAELEALLHRLAETPVEVRQVCRPAAGEGATGSVLKGMAVPQRRVLARPLDGWSAVAKRTEDLV